MREEIRKYKFLTWNMFKETFKLVFFALQKSGGADRSFNIRFSKKYHY